MADLGQTRKPRLAIFRFQASFLPASLWLVRTRTFVQMKGCNLPRKEGEKSCEICENFGDRRVCGVHFESRRLRLQKETRTCSEQRRLFQVSFG